MILIIANSRYKGGTSGSDCIYESFIKFWPHKIKLSGFQDLDYKPFLLCYLHRILLSCYMALFDTQRYSFVYTASDFLPDSLAGFIYRLKGTKWVAGFYLDAFRENRLHYLSQKVVKWIIRRFADMVIVTNPTMYHLFPEKKKTWINGGIDLSLAGLSDEPKIYDAVFCGRIHPSKGIKELAEIWREVRAIKSDAKLAVIGDGDLGIGYLRGLIGPNMGVTYFGYMGDERYKVYKQSKVVLYPTPLKYDHFSMAPVEAMACGCPIVTFCLPTVAYFNPIGTWALDVPHFAKRIVDIRVSNFSALKAVEWAQQFDYKKQALRVLEDIEKELN